MIIDSFDNKSEAIINPRKKADAVKVDACILTFSYEIENYVLANYPCKRIASFWFATGETPLYQIDYKGKKLAFFKTFVGGPACVGSVEDTLSEIDTDTYVVFGGAGCLDKEISHGKVMVPTEAYRDEGTSYHYALASDYITVKNSNTVAEFMKKNGLPFVQGRTWTTDAFYRETFNNFKKRKEDGCISVEMECASLQAMCDFRNLNLYMFFTSGDLLDAPEWDVRHKNGEKAGTQHDIGHFDIAIELAHYVSK